MNSRKVPVISKTTAQGGSSKSKSARRRQNRSLRKELATKVSKDPRWGFNLKNLKLGPLGLGSFEGSSRSDPEMVGLSNFSNNIQVVMPRIRSEFRKDGSPIDVLFGTEYLTSLGTDDEGSLPGDILFSFPVNPNNFGLTRLAQFAPLYQRYRFRKLIFWFESSANATDSGQLIGFTDYDIDNILSVDTPDNLSIAAAHFDQEVTKVWENMGFTFGVVDEFTNLFTSLTGGAEDRLVYQGNYYLISASVLPAEFPLGNIYVDYEIEFSIPQLGVSETSGPTAFSGRFVSSLTYAKPLGSGGYIPINTFPDNLVQPTYNADTGTLSFSGMARGQYLALVISEISNLGTLTGPFEYSDVIIPQVFSGDDAITGAYVLLNETSGATTIVLSAWTQGLQVVNCSDGNIVLTPIWTQGPAESSMPSPSISLTDLVLVRIGPIQSASENDRPNVFGRAFSQNLDPRKPCFKQKKFVRPKAIKNTVETGHAQMTQEITIAKQASCPCNVVDRKAKLASPGIVEPEGPPRRGVSVRPEEDTLSKTAHPRGIVCDSCGPSAISRIISALAQIDHSSPSREQTSLTLQPVDVSDASGQKMNDQTAQPSVFPTRVTIPR
jgi:hypothetical protein